MIITIDNRESIAWDQLLKKCYDKGFHSILIEGGTAVFSDAISAGVVNELNLFLAPKLLGEKDAKSFLELP